MSRERYRPRLISDVVTGKLDVREAAAGLPEEMEQEEPEEIETDEGFGEDVIESSHVEMSSEYEEKE